MKLQREQALELMAYLSIIKMDNEEREGILIDVFSEDDSFKNISDYSDPVYNPKIIEYLKNNFIGITNQYIEEFLNDRLDSQVQVIGEDAKMIECPCCGYQTLDSRGQYDICKVCYWEDDGSNEPDRYSSVNSMTLQEARDNFRKSGAISDSFKESVDSEGKLKYRKS